MSWGSSLGPGGHTRGAWATLGGSVSILAATLVAGIIIARVLGPVGKGDLTRLVAFAALAVDLALIGVDEAITVFVAKNPSGRVGLLRSLESPLRLQALLGLGILVGLLSVAGQLSVGMSLPIVAFGLLVPLEINMVRSRSYLLGRGSFRSFNLTRILAEASPVVAILFLALGDYLTLSTAALSYLLAVAAGWLFASRKVRGDLADVHHTSIIGTTGITSEFWSFARRNLASQLAARGNAQIDILLLALLAIPSARLGEYSVASTAGISITIIGTSFGMIGLPRVSSVLDGASPWPTLRPIIVAAVGLSAIAATLVWLLAPTLIPLIYGEGFAAAIGLTRVLVVGGFSLSVARVLTASLRGMGRPGAVGLAEAVGAVVTGLGILLLGTEDLVLVAASATAGFATNLGVQSALMVHNLHKTSPPA